MKRLVTLFTVFVTVPLFTIGQSLKDIDYISPFNDSLSAIQKDSKWAFIDTSGELVIDFRDDLVLTTIGDQKYPVFNSGRCLIVKKKDGISYFGYIDNKGRTVLEPQYLNATNFDNGMAIVLRLHKTNLGKNDILDKNMIDYSYTTIAIDPQGDTVHYLSDKPKHITLSRDYVGIPPQIKVKFISEALIAIKSEDHTWIIKKINEAN
ncbi:MAG: WG repeat-containing protein [Bacteroidota bacterium]